MTPLTQNYPPLTQITAKAAANLPQSTAGALFNVTGRVAIFALELEVGTAIQDQANNTKLQYNPTNGSTTDITAALNIQNDPTRTRYYATSTNTDAMKEAADGAVSFPFFSSPLTFPAGAVELDCAASNTGTVSAVIHWSPLTPGSTVTSA